MLQQMLVWWFVTSFPTKVKSSKFTAGLGRFAALRPSRSSEEIVMKSAVSLIQSLPAPKAVPGQG